MKMIMMMMGTNIHALCGIRTHALSVQAMKNSDRAATGTADCKNQKCKILLFRVCLSVGCTSLLHNFICYHYLRSL
jgi:hypothetical protein